MIILLIAPLILLMVFLFCALKVSSKCSRWEEEHEKEIQD